MVVSQDMLELLAQMSQCAKELSMRIFRRRIEAFI